MTIEACAANSAGIAGGGKSGGSNVGAFFGMKADEERKKEARCMSYPAAASRMNNNASPIAHIRRCL